MKPHQIQLELTGFRAIKEANIILDGLTVVAGENGSGKSSLSKFLYYIFKLSNEFDELVDIKENERLKGVRDFFVIYDNNSDYNRYHNKAENWIEKIDSTLEKYESTSNLDKKVIRLKSILAEILNNKDIEIDKVTLPKMLEELRREVVIIGEEAKREKKERPLSLLISSLSPFIPVKDLPKPFFTIMEYGVPIISSKLERVSTHTIQSLAYIDTPMLLNEYYYILRSNNHWGDIKKIIEDSNLYKDFTGDGIEAEISKIIKGDATYKINTDIINTEKSRFIYKRSDDKEFNLLDCATGIKSFSILQMMLKNGFLDKNTLLLIDEPEAHLHPQWIIEYARLIVLLNKHIGVKFFIASHNPDMVSAIKYISEKEKVDDNLNFYFAEPDESGYQYTYKHLGTNIEPIFKSFNIALDRIDQYGTKEE